MDTLELVSLTRDPWLAEFVRVGLPWREQVALSRAEAERKDSLLFHPTLEASERLLTLQDGRVAVWRRVVLPRQVVAWCFYLK